MSLLPGVGVPGAGGEPPNNTIIYGPNDTPGPWMFPVPPGVLYVEVEGWGAGGPGCLGGGGKSFPPGNGGGGGAYFKIHLSVTGGSTVLSGAIGAPGNVSGPTGGGDTTLPASSCTAHGGGFATLGAEGAHGTATGGDTNTSGRAGGLTNAWDGGGAGNGGGDQTAQSGSGTPPGGGSAGASFVVATPAAGRITITSVTS